MSAKQTLLALMVKHKAKCHYCGREVLLHLPPPEPLAPTIDHVVPRSQDGSSQLFNLVLSCYRCNHDKKDVPWHYDCDTCNEARRLNARCKLPGHGPHRVVSCNGKVKVS